MAFNRWTSRNRSSALAGAIAILLPVEIASGQSQNLNATVKSEFNLFHPTPKELLRELSADRPDKTESAYTVDAGHFQIEMDLVGYTRDHEKSDGTDLSLDSFSVVPMNLKVGVLNNVDFQVLIEPFIHERTRNRTTGIVERKSGFGDIQSRVKVNLWGNDHGRTALAVMPFVKFPTSQDNLSNDAFEGGIIFPFAADLPGGLGLGAMTEFDFNEDANGSVHHTEYVNTVTVSRDLFGSLSGYVEFFSQVSNDTGSEWVGTFDFGFGYAINPDVRLDAGINIGVTDSADDLNPFVGMTIRY